MIPAWLRTYRSALRRFTGAPEAIAPRRQKTPPFLPGDFLGERPPDCPMLSATCRALVSGRFEVSGGSICHAHYRRARERRRQREAQRITLPELAERVFALEERS